MKSTTYRLHRWGSSRRSVVMFLIFLICGALLIGGLRYGSSQALSRRAASNQRAFLQTSSAQAAPQQLAVTDLSTPKQAAQATVTETVVITTTRTTTDMLAVGTLPTDTVTVTGAATTGTVATGAVTTDVATRGAVATGEDETGGEPPLERTLNILILGSDRRPNTTNWRTDVMMIVALDFAQARAGVISIPRDLYIDAIPNHQPNRVNVIDYLGERDEADGGGPALLSLIIQERMGIRIDHFLRFDFNSFQAVVDALGGVDVDIDCPFRDYFSVENTLLNLEPGIVHMDGAQALVYVRSRRFGGDLDRVRRQQRFVWAVRNQMLQQNMLPRVPALYEALNDSIQTDIGIVNAIRIVRFALSLEEDAIHGFVLTPPDLLTSGWRSGMSVFIPDWPTIRSAVQTVFERDAFVETNTPTRCP